MTIVVLIIIAIFTIFVTIKRKKWIANFKGYVGERKVSFILNRLPPEYITLNPTSTLKIFFSVEVGLRLKKNLRYETMSFCRGLNYE